MKELLKKNAYWIKWSLSLGLLTIIFFNVEWATLAQSFKLVKWWFYPIIVCIAILNLGIATLRWGLFAATQF